MLYSCTHMTTVGVKGLREAHHTHSVNPLVHRCVQRRGMTCVWSCHKEHLTQCYDCITRLTGRCSRSMTCVSSAVTWVYWTMCLSLSHDFRVFNSQTRRTVYSLHSPSCLQVTTRRHPNTSQYPVTAWSIMIALLQLWRRMCLGSIVEQPTSFPGRVK